MHSHKATVCPWLYYLIRLWAWYFYEVIVHFSSQKQDKIAAHVSWRQSKIPFNTKLIQKIKNFFYLLCWKLGRTLSLNFIEDGAGQYNKLTLVCTGLSWNQSWNMSSHHQNWCGSSWHSCNSWSAHNFDYVMTHFMVDFITDPWCHFLFSASTARMIHEHHAMTYFVFPYIIWPITLLDEHRRLCVVVVKSNINNQILIIERRFVLSQIGEHLNTHLFYNYHHPAVGLPLCLSLGNQSLIVELEHLGWSQPLHLGGNLVGGHCSLCHSHPSSAEAIGHQIFPLQLTP